MKRCKCGSYAINHNCHGRDGSDGDLCDVCYWRKRAEAVREPLSDQDINDVVRAHGSGGWRTPVDMLLFARAIETAHGIKQ